MGPEAWSEWNENDMMYMTGLGGEATGQQEAYTPWSPQPQPSFNDFDIWKPQPDEPLGRPLWSSALPSFLQEELGDLDGPWQVPQKLDVEGTDSRVPMSSWASPLRVPLPDPMVEEGDRPFAEDPLSLEPSPEPGYSAFAKAAPWACAEEVASFIQPPPGLASEALAVSPTAVVSPSTDVTLPPGMSLCTLDLAGRTCTRVEWRIEDLYGKLQASMGRPLVSPPFAALGLPNLRLMVFPDGRDTMKNARSGERKGLYAAMIKKGPLHGALKLKADCLQCATVMTVNLTVGTVRSGPLVYNFSEQAIHGLDDFGADWLKQVDKTSGSLTVGIEILDVQSQTQ
eukprot:CAMPEP_0197651454 /NCGR_PEP_ID=MMETSP1338-20131121/32571_1 /TAXON_ID=43686 ORGANISM="Pelagodinium beii, Strain RCC1491" /NCGR_SAMPLE_ID=MMETSP1338 /ASSEMBLY_ACC=CAM_ASM_000754 /LENGTH=340 /DNA_ID=CAMNT_0043226085 /DNA_START=100 /DNA_END=1122 /DNA_ORIENTATION=+